MPKLKQKLRNLLISRIDLVDNPDNPEAQIMLFKREHEARKTSEGSALWEAIIQEAQPPLGKGNKMFTSVGEIAEAMKKGEIESQEDALKVFDEFVEGEVKKSDYQMSVNQARLMKMTGPGWDSYYNAFMRLPATIEEGQAIEKQQRTADNVIKVIEGMAKELVQKGQASLTKEQAFMEVLKSNPELEGAYREATK